MLWGVDFENYRGEREDLNEGTVLLRSAGVGTSWPDSMGEVRWSGAI